MNKIIISGDNEATESPYWIIIDPSQNFNLGNKGVYNIAGMITGIWFSRKSAEDYLSCRRHNFSEHAVVFCCSGHHSKEYGDAVKNGKCNNAKP